MMYDNGHAIFKIFRDLDDVDWVPAWEHEAPMEKNGWPYYPKQDTWMNNFMKWRRLKPSDVINHMIMNLFSGYTSYTDRFGNTCNLATGDGLPVVAYDHTYADTTDTFSNRGKAPLDSKSMVFTWMLMGAPSVIGIVTSAEERMKNRLRVTLPNLLPTGSKMEKVEIRHYIIPELPFAPPDKLQSIFERKTKRLKHMEDAWFMFDYKQRRAHYRELDDGRVEVCVPSPHWIFGNYPNS